MYEWPELSQCDSFPSKVNDNLFAESIFLKVWYGHRLLQQIACRKILKVPAFVVCMYGYSAP